MNRIIYAYIKIPIELLDDGNIKSYNEYLNVEFEECDKLPDYYEEVDVMKKLIDYLYNKEGDEDYEEDADSNPSIENDKKETETPRNPIEELSMVVLKGDIKSKSRPVNSSFKNKRFRHRQTAKTIISIN